MVLLGIDYGQRRIGLALSVNSIIETRGWLDWGKEKEGALDKIKEVCQKEGVDKVVVGISGGKMGQEAEKFGKSLIKMLKLPLEFVDESLTSWQAEKMVGWQDKGRVDSVSAALILERYLGM